ncbi:hypothetical protein C9E81_05335 [Paracoccus alkanivorans]|uniref:Thiol:disulfide interchange protein DsbD N-terminal domain-containing protein n=2 Tax=Paracoccus alkanivorans TaxID=2116655 RepID=A0A3M0MXP2_9RHOB|nr:hypothetical protein C9E81_05335 [Paracoccus alkanivorans]
MIRTMSLTLCTALTVLPAAAEQLPPGVVSARLLPGWTDGDGNRVSALELRLEPGWKTYWRNPGDSGLPPSFDWRESENLAEVAFHWPAPEAIRSGGELTLGYHDLLVLPFTAKPADPGRPVELAAGIDLGVCEKICVPAHFDLQAPAAGERPDPVIETALSRMPEPLPATPACTRREIEDGIQLSVLLPRQEVDVAAMELDGHPDIWVSTATLEAEGQDIRATADFVPPSGEPFDLDVDNLRITLIGTDGAVEMRGCDLQTAAFGG